MLNSPVSVSAAALVQKAVRATLASSGVKVRDADPSATSLIEFTRSTYSAYKSDPFHVALADALQQVVEGKLTRLMVFAPPQHGKSQLASVQFPAYWLGKRPNDPVIISSYGARLATTHSYHARNTVASSEFQAIFPNVKVRNDSSAQDFWQIEHPYRGRVMSAGVGGAITGFGALLGIVDDPFENWEQAQSATYREKVWDWYRSTFRTRLWEGGSIVLVCTRWHEDDLAGRLLRSQQEKWTVLRFPAISETQDERDQVNRKYGMPAGLPDPLNREPGQPLSPSRFSVESLQQIKQDVGSVVWACEYQQDAAATAGTMIKREWFHLVDEGPVEVIGRVRYWDKAASENEKGAATAGVLIAHGRDGLWYIEHVVQGFYSSFKREEVIYNQAVIDRERYGTSPFIVMEQEPGSGGKDSAQFTIANLAGFPVHRDLPTGAKDVRLHPFAAQLEAGNVRIVRGPWTEAFIDEMVAVPNGMRRDQVDAGAGGFNYLATKLNKTWSGAW